MRSLVVIMIVGVGLVSGTMQYIDLTHNWGNSTLRIPGSPEFILTVLNKRPIPNTDAEMLGQKYETAEHFGTHIDAPHHFCPQGKYLHQIDIEELSGPGVVIDLQGKAAANPDYRATPQDILDWEAEHGAIPYGAVAMINFGWYKRWSDPKQFFSTDDVTNSDTFHFPGLTVEASRYLTTRRKVIAVGVDTPSPDGWKSGTEVHQNVLCDARVVILENLDNLDAVPATGSRVYMGAVKLEYGGGGPVRVFATLDDDESHKKIWEWRLVDLTHNLGNSTLKVAGSTPFELTNLNTLKLNEKATLFANKFSAAEHFGTHIDAPRHFCPKGKYVHELPMEKLAGPGVVIDLKDKAEKDPSYLATLDDVKTWEEKNGDIPKGAVVLINFGWHNRWKDPKEYFNTTELSNTSTYKFPGLKEEASQYIAGDKQAIAIGVDTLSPDGWGNGAPNVHINILCTNDIVILENIANLDDMPATGSHVFMAAAKLEYGGGAPLRLFAAAKAGAGSITSNGVGIGFLLSMVMMLLR